MTTVENLKKYLDKIKKENKKINAILEIRDEKELLKEAEEIDKKIKNKTQGKLAGKIIIIKANLCVKGLKTSCASKALENYVAPYDAEVVSKVKKEDGLIIGTGNMDEFASGTSGETSAFGPCQNPILPGFIPGGSSSGPAASVAAGFCDIALGSDTGGSIRCPASFCGIFGLKPSYSVVSRYGLIDLAMSTDTIGPLAKNLEDCELMFEVISGKDEKDAISQDLKKLVEIKKLKIGVLDLEGLKVDEKIKKVMNDFIDKFKKKNNCEIKKVKIKYLDLAVETYYPIVYVEAFSGTRKLDGRRFGKKIEDVAGPEFLRRILGGSEITKAEYGGRYYHKSLQTKEFFSEEFNKIFKEFDCLICPTMPLLPWKIGADISVEEAYAADSLTIPASLTGSCAISIPIGKIEKFPIGIQIMCNQLEDLKLLRIAKQFEKN